SQCSGLDRLDLDGRATPLRGSDKSSFLGLSLESNPERTRFLTTGGDRGVRAWDASGGDVVALPGARGVVRLATTTTDADKAVVGVAFSDWTIARQPLDGETAKPQRRAVCEILGIAIQPRTGWIVTGHGGDSRARIWNYGAEAFSTDAF